jgi:RNA polymerase sigma factor (sigma-70 family)
MGTEIEAQVERAVAGDRAALEAVVRGIQDRVYGLALRMLWHPDDAEDATQEILIRIVTHLGSFRGESAFMTWVYRVAANYLLATRKRRAEREGLTFEHFGADLDEGLAGDSPDTQEEVEERLLVEEVKVGCTHGMLLCLDRDHRLAYILGEIMEVGGEEGASILQIAPAAFRKRLSRARARIEAFMRARCGLVDAANPCRCARRVPHAIEAGRVDPHHLLFAGRPACASEEDTTIRERVRELHELRAAAALYRSHPTYAAPEGFVASLKRLVESDRFAALRGQ